MGAGRAGRSDGHPVAEQGFCLGLEVEIGTAFLHGYHQLGDVGTQLIPCRGHQLGQETFAPTVKGGADIPVAVYAYYATARPSRRGGVFCYAYAAPVAIAPG